MGKHTSKPSYYLQFPPEGFASPAANRDTTRLVWLRQKKERKTFWNNVFTVSVLVPIPKEGKRGRGGCKGQGWHRACCKISTWLCRIDVGGGQSDVAFTRASDSIWLAEELLAGRPPELIRDHKSCLY